MVGTDADKEDGETKKGDSLLELFTLQPDTQTWGKVVPSADQVWPSARTDPVVGSLNGQLLVAGGTSESVTSGDTKKPLLESWVYTLETSVWTQLPDCPLPLSMASSVMHTASDTLHVIGGVSGVMHVTLTPDGQWNTLPDLPIKACKPPLVSVGPCVLAVTHKAVMQYDTRFPSLNGWTTHQTQTPHSNSIDAYKSGTAALLDVDRVLLLTDSGDMVLIHLDPSTVASLACTTDTLAATARQLHTDISEVVYRVVGHLLSTIHEDTEGERETCLQAVLAAVDVDDSLCTLAVECAWRERESEDVVVSEWLAQREGERDYVTNVTETAIEGGERAITAGVWLSRLAECEVAVQGGRERLSFNRPWVSMLSDLCRASKGCLATPSLSAVLYLEGCAPTVPTTLGGMLSAMSKMAVEYPSYTPLWTQCVVEASSTVDDVVYLDLSDVSLVGPEDQDTCLKGYCMSRVMSFLGSEAIRQCLKGQEVEVSAFSPDTPHALRECIKAMVSGQSVDWGHDRKERDDGRVRRRRRRRYGYRDGDQEAPPKIAKRCDKAV
ncbi:hypothetical protein KIPB_002599 [Kipferlia bialata]|uniref:Kelch-type beta propeller n=1 Tax=Kipferlia bialata TaxID=797122 RepID=A0A9K3GF28_9EUKA|nr:hypothetical protein KIPB_002599 [Kipferlia bialata]|eukprot:g2599.t1